MATDCARSSPDPIPVVTGPIDRGPVGTPGESDEKVKFALVEFVVPEDTIRELIRYYTREAGVRSLERALGGLARKAVREMSKEKTLSITVEKKAMINDTAKAGIRPT